MEGYDILGILLILISAWIGGFAMKRIGYPAILGELLVGILVGPALLGWIDSNSTIDVLAETGIIMLMAYIGMEINFKDLGKASKAGLLAALGGFLVPFILGYYAITITGGTQISGFFVGIAVGVTSLVTKSRILVDLNLLDTRIAYVLMVGALISDTLALIIFAGLSSFIDAGYVDTMGVVIVAVKALLFFGLTSVLGLYILPYVGKLFTKYNIKDKTLYFTLLLVIVFGFSELAEIAGLHSILGAFMAGLFVRDGIFEKQITKQVNSVFHNVSIGFMAPIFFVSTGFQVTLDVFKTDLNLLILILVIAFAGKILGAVLFYLPSGHGWREGLAVGAGMNGRGAVEIIIAGIGLQKGVITQEVFSILVFMAILTTLSVPIMLTWTTNWLQKSGKLVRQKTREGFLIMGANSLALLMSKYLKDSNKVTLIDSNKDLVASAKANGFNCIHGNALESNTLEEVGAKNFKTFLGLTSNSEINLLVAQLAHDAFYIPEKHIVLTPGEGRAGISLLKSISTSTLFASKINIDNWIKKIQNNEHKELFEKVEQKMPTREWLKSKLSENVKILPILVIDKNENKRPFHYNDTIDIGETVLYIV
ncbi:High-affinity Na(+)/H(+) antiporter NhaS3 [Mariniflexile rhizosphaerae]|uniref:cation:proton antiporter n=1 Tax=unclassified Mariniflexile TaxID=2643887 RepID=UPI000CC600D3|nr:cation:proton antiporter [Mariniflexile sp. TRM1-10]AXP80656.1 High-affinity Na(+)/H(+) antiporter NhaS3 [Mariniflexile sp. TRM1-10]PLB17789.1 MAG: Sodium/hydrogen exchanger [Flavobacteriaceae bacterium FS1-H7996/R]